MSYKRYRMEKKYLQKYLYTTQINTRSIDRCQGNSNEKMTEDSRERPHKEIDIDTWTMIGFL